MKYYDAKSSQPVAVIGIACRLPGNVSTPEQFWDLLQSGRDGFSETSKRFNADGFYHPQRNKRNATSTKGAHYLSQDIATFDASFFNITHAEALAMDPQQRMALEVAYEAFENSGTTLDQLSNSNTGCFIGASTNDWQTMMTRDAEFGLPYVVTGANPEFLSNRISWFFNLKGPSMTTNTACSSSLVSLHLACQSLLTGESSMAIVGGVNALLTPGTFIALASQGFLAPDGRSKSFDASADGYGRGEGCGMIILKRLDDALRDGDQIRAVIRGTGVNSDGLTQGITMPSTVAQTALIREVYAAAGIDPADTQYAEAHGTGTKAGDPVELHALSKAIAVHDKQSQNLFVGSAKPNIGHLEAAAGIAGLIKGILALEKGVIPPNILFKTPNPDIKFEQWRLKIPTRLTPWPPCNIRRISINSFGVGGTNAHAVVEEATRHQNSFSETNAINSCQRKEYSTVAVSDSRKRLFVLSAHDEAGIARVCSNLAQNIESAFSDVNPADLEAHYLANLSYTLSNKRSKLPWKTFCIAPDLQTLLKNLCSSDIAPNLRSHQQPRLGFVFTGQGAQWAQMGIELFRYPVFCDSVQESDQYLHVFGCPWNSREELQKPENLSNINRADYCQPVCTILQMALIDLLKSWGIHPQKVIGHSSGEIAAAYCIGAVNKRDAVAIALHRGLSSALLASIAPELKGGMLAIGCSLEEAHVYISEVNSGNIMVACVNSAHSVTVSGDITGLEQLESLLSLKGVFARRLQVDIAYHSQHMHRIATIYEAAISASIQKSKLLNGTLGAKQPNLSGHQAAMISSVRAATINSADINPSYWIQNLVAPVLFSDALRELMTPLGSDGRSKTSEVDLLIELGPHSALKGPIKQILDSNDIKQVSYATVLMRGKPADETIMNVAGMLWSRGYPVDIANVNDDKGCQMLKELSPYPWNHSRRFWPYPRIVQEFLDRKYPRKGLLGAPVSSYSADERIWSGYLRLSEEPWLMDHVIQTSTLLPGSAYIVMALEAARQMADPGKVVKSYKIRDFEITGATVLSDNAEVETAVQFRPHLLGTLDSSSPSWWEFTIATGVVGEKGLRQNCRGLIFINYDIQRPECMLEDEEEITKSAMEHMDLYTSQTLDFDVDEFYTLLRTVGLRFGDKFRNITKLRIGPGICCYDVTLPDPGDAYSSGQSERPYIIHPTTLDAFFQGVSGALIVEKRKQSTIPKSIEELEIFSRIDSTAGTEFHGYCNAKWHGMRDIIADIHILSDDCSYKTLSIKGYRSTDIDDSDNSKTGQTGLPRALCFKEDWQPLLQFLTRDEIRMALSGRCEIEQIISKCLELYLHQYATASILDIQGETFIPLTTTISQDKSIDYTVSIKQSKTEVSPDSLLDNVEILTLDLTAQLPENLPRFDFLILRQLWDGLASIKEADTVLGNIKTLSRSGATTLILVQSPDAEKTRELILRHGYDIQCELSEEGLFMILGRCPALNNDNDKQREVVIIEPEARSEFLKAFVSTLREEMDQQGISHTTIGWDLQLPNLVRGKQCVVLNELENSILERLGPEDFSILQQLISTSSSLLWTTGFEGPAANIITGMLRTIRHEMPEWKGQVLHFSSAVPAMKAANLLGRVIGSVCDEYEFKESGGLLYTPRILQDEEFDMSVHESLSEQITRVAIDCSTSPLRLGIGKPGQLGSLYFEPDDRVALPLGDHEIEIATKASGMNFRDIMTSMGLLPDPLIGLEASGVVTRIGSSVTRVRIGDRVCVMTSGAHATHVRALEHLCEVIPDSITFEEAASIAVVHCTAYHAFVNLARLRKGQSVLIHAGAGGVGQAAIQLAAHLGLTIYTTVGSEEKRQLLKSSYGIPDEHIFSSRDSSFVKGIKRVTHGRGVDCVLNSLAGELLRQSWYCVSQFGIFIEIGMRDILGNMRLDMRPFQKHATFTFFSLLEVIAEAPPPIDRVFPETFANLRKGIIRAPTPVMVFPLETHQEAFRLMQAGKHRGKVVLSYQEKSEVPVLRRPRDHLRLDSKITYLLVGGLGGLGRSLGRMLFDSGARYISFLSRSGASSVESQQTLKDLTQDGCIVKAYKCDVSDSASLKNALQQCSLEMPPIRGVVQLAMVLQDAAFTSMTHEQWVRSTEPKIQGTLNLHNSFQNDLDFFIILSSIAGVFGNRGQANYAAACAYQDELAAFRRQQGLKAISIDLGIMREVGVLAEKGSTGDVRRWEESLGISEAEFHGLMKSVIQRQANMHDEASILITGLPTSPMLKKAGLNRPAYFQDPRFSHLSQSKGSDDAILSSDDESSIGLSLAEADTTEAAAEIITNALVRKVAEILGTPESEIDISRSLYTFGIDSLVAMEIRSWIIKDMKADITLFDILAATPIAKFALKIAEESRLVTKTK